MVAFVRGFRVCAAVFFLAAAGVYAADARAQVVTVYDTTTPNVVSVTNDGHIIYKATVAGTMTAFIRALATGIVADPENPAGRPLLVRATSFATLTVRGLESCSIGGGCAAFGLEGAADTGARLASLFAMNLRTLTMFAASGADLDEEIGVAVLLFHLATANKSLHVSALAAAGADVNAGRRFSPLYRAADFGKAAAIRILLSAGAEIDARSKDVNRYTPLHRAVIGGHFAAAATLLAEGANVNAVNVGDWTPLHFAANSGRDALAAALLPAGASVNAKGNGDNTPADRAVLHNHAAAASVIIANGGACSEHSALNCPSFGIPFPPQNLRTVFVANSGTRLMGTLSAPVPGFRSGFAPAPGEESITVAAVSVLFYKGTTPGTTTATVLAFRATTRLNALFPVLQLTTRAPLTIRALSHCGIASGCDGFGLEGLTTEDARFNRLTAMSPAELSVYLESGAPPTESRGNNYHSAANFLIYRLAVAGAGTALSAYAAAETDLNRRDNFAGNTALHRISSDPAHSARLLIAVGADLNARDNNSDTPLIDAAFFGDTADAILLINAGADLAARNRFANTAMDRAIFRGNQSVINVLRAAGAPCNREAGNANCPSPPPQPPVVVPGPNTIFVVRSAELTASGVVDDDFFPAPDSGSVVYQARPANLASVSAEGGVFYIGESAGTMTATIFAITGTVASGGGFAPVENATGTVSLVLRGLTVCSVGGGCDAFGLEEDDFSARLHDFTEMSLQTLTMFAASGADPDEEVGSGVLLWHLATASRPAHVAALAAAGADLNAGRRFSPLYRAADFGNAAAIRILAEAGAAIDGRSKDGNLYAPLHRAVIGGHLAAAATLLAQGANVNATNAGGWTPLHFAANSGRDALAAALVAATASINAKGNGGDAPLHRAAINGRITVLLSLLYAGASVNLQGGSNNTPLDYALANNRTAAVATLRNEGALCNTRSDALCPALGVNLTLQQHPNTAFIRRTGGHSAPGIVAALNAAPAKAGDQFQYQITPPGLLQISQNRNTLLYIGTVTTQVTATLRAVVGETRNGVFVPSPQIVAAQTLTLRGLAHCGIVQGCDAFGMQGRNTEDARFNRLTAMTPRELSMYFVAGAPPTESRGNNYHSAANFLIYRLAVAGAGTALSAYAAAGTDLNRRDNFAGNTALHRIASETAHSARLLIAVGADLNARDNNSDTPLIDAAFFGDTADAILLINAGADLAARSRFASTAMDRAIFRGNQSVINVLRAAGAPCNREAGNANCP